MPTVLKSSRRIVRGAVQPARENAMFANTLKRLLHHLQRTTKSLPPRDPVEEPGADLSPTQRAIARAARKNPWMLAG